MKNIKRVGFLQSYVSNVIPNQDNSTQKTSQARIRESFTTGSPAPGEECQRIRIKLPKN